MTKIQIRKVNGVPMGRPVNPHQKQRQIEFEPPIYTVNEDWKHFEQSVTEHEAPGFEEGEAEGFLQWQWKHPFDKDWQNEPIHEPYFDMNKEHEISVHQGNETRQIWIVPTTEKVEVKEPKSLIIESALIHEIPAISKRTGISPEWLAVWYEVEMFYGDVQKKETREDLLLRLQTQYKLTAV